jgi:Mg/Co/Ni transporter MgtE
MKDLEM